MEFFTPKVVGFFSDDHSLYLDIKNMPGKYRSILIDCGNNHTLSVREFIRISTVLISHAHIDHFIGFDNIIRMNLREDKRILVVGPHPMSTIMHHRLQGYIWNLIYDSKFEIEVWDIHPRSIKKYLFKCCEGFSKKHYLGSCPGTELLFENDYYTCKYIRLNHGITSIGYSITERTKVNVDKVELKKLNLSGGQWLQKLKDKRFSDLGTITTDDGTQFSAEQLYNLLIRHEPGQKISYITDTIVTEELQKKIVRFVNNSDYLYCESSFLERDIELAQKYYHLTAHQAGLLAKLSESKKLYLIHLSQRYNNPDELLQEAQKIFAASEFPHFRNQCRLQKKL